ncbi:hypothetical protein RHA1_ro03241 [Rhodococcus jostii RHA1]|uniref:Uncharacterized protein n=1 Tax=Rhodococcus jostii (strain RHA1) TaxID=101510 RepID=Q0SBP2_RHOJR|nr:hypothetical protein RHA1_ro03241 [Rhodococcus jostii RHA1]
MLDPGSTPLARKVDRWRPFGQNSLHSSTFRGIQTDSAALIFPVRTTVMGKPPTSWMTESSSTSSARRSRCGALMRSRSSNARTPKGKNVIEIRRCNGFVACAIPMRRWSRPNRRERCVRGRRMPLSKLRRSRDLRCHHVHGAGPQHRLAAAHRGQHPAPVVLHLETPRTVRVVRECAGRGQHGRDQTHTPD